jgi:alpha-L-arabinofuranosidase
MTGLENNGGAVLGGSYAPLLVNVNNIPWATNLIWFDNSRHYVIPSYHVQRLFAENAGAASLPTMVSPDDELAASATCADQKCGKIALKLVNIASEARNATVTVAGVAARLIARTGMVTVLTSGHAMDENSFDKPNFVAPTTKMVDGLGPVFMLELPPLSVSVLSVDVVQPTLGRGNEAGAAIAEL